MSRRARFVSLAGLAALGAIAASCGAFSEGETAAPNDAGGDATPIIDATPASDAPVTNDAGSAECEALNSEAIVMLTGVNNIAADAFHVYASTTTGVFRADITPGGAPLPIASDPVSDVVVTDNFVVFRRTDGLVQLKAKVSPQAFPSTAAVGVDTTAIEPRTQDDYAVLRSSDVVGCNASNGCPASVLLARTVRDVVVRGTSADFLADESGGVGVFHCATFCNVADAGTHLAAGGANVPDLVSDVDHLYWIDRNAGSVRRVARAGGLAQDVMTGLIAPSSLALDNQSHILVGTPANGVYRGSIAGECHATPRPGDVVVALTVGPTGAFIGTASELRKLIP